MRGDRASTLLFFPAALLVTVVLAAVAVDLARVHLRQRQLDDLAAAVANDAVTVGLDPDRLRSDGTYRLSPARVDRVAATHVHGGQGSGLEDLRVATRVRGLRSVEVTAATTVRLGFARVIPRAPRRLDLVARATAEAAVG